MTYQYFSVKKGHTPGLFTNSQEFERSIYGFNNPKYKCFLNKRDATQYLGPVKLRHSNIENWCTLQFYIVVVMKPPTGEIGFGLVVLHNQQIVERYYGGYESNGCVSLATYIALSFALSLNKDIANQEHRLEIIISDEFVHTEFQKYSSRWRSDNFSNSYIRPKEHAGILKTCLRKLSDYDITFTFDAYPDGKEGYEHAFRQACMAVDQKVDDVKSLI
jgi:hypothetical protein